MLGGRFPREESWVLVALTRRRAMVGGEEKKIGAPRLPAERSG